MSRSSRFRVVRIMVRLFFVLKCFFLFRIFPFIPPQAALRCIYLTIDTSNVSCRSPPRHDYFQLEAVFSPLFTTRLFLPKRPAFYPPHIDFWLSLFYHLLTVPLPCYVCTFLGILCFLPLLSDTANLHVATAAIDFLLPRLLPPHLPPFS